MRSSTSSKSRFAVAHADEVAAAVAACGRGDRNEARALLEAGRLTADEQATVRAAIAESLEIAGQFEEGIALLAHYEDPAGHPELSDEVSSLVWLQLASLYRWLNEVPRSITFASHALRAAATDASRGRAHRVLGYVYWMIDEYAIGRDHTVRALEHLQCANDPHELANALWSLALVDSVEGHSDDARQHCLRGLELLKGTPSRSPRDHLLIGRLLTYMGHISSERGDVHRAIADYERSIEHWSCVEDTRFLALAYNNLGDALIAVGEWKRAEAALLTAIQYIRRSTAKRPEPTIMLTLAELQLCQGKLDEAEETTVRALEIAQSRGPKSAEAESLLTLGRVRHAQGRYDDAKAAFGESIALEERLGRMVDLPETHVAFAELLLDLGDRDAAGASLRRAQTVLGEQPNLYHSGLLARAEGRYRAALGEHPEAISSLAQSISLFESTSYVYQAAVSHFELGRVLAETGNTLRASSHFKRAHRTFVELHAERERERVEAALAAQRRSGVAVSASPSVFTLDALIIERLLAASSTHELLLRELATIIRDETQETAVVFETNAENELRLVTARGCDRDYATAAGKEVASFLADGTQPPEAKIKQLADRREPSPRRFLLYTTAETSSAIGHLDSLLKLVEQGLEICSLKAASAGARLAARIDKPAFEAPLGIVAASPAMRSVIDQIRRIRSSNVTVLITGESGVGKELVARAVHHESARRAKSFLPFNCAAVPEDLVESRLFGHRKGAFTGATSDRVGIARAAEGGSLFLDEIGEVSLEIQPKLLRFLQDHEIQPLGEDRPLTVDVRVIAATNRNLEELVAERSFREDLYYRLNVIRISVPPLRERREDIPVLAAKFLEDAAGRETRAIQLSDDAVKRLEAYAWPGNVRQLRNEIERAVAMVEDGGILLPEHFSREIASSTVAPRREVACLPKALLAALDGEALDPAVRELEYHFVNRALERYGGNITHAARALGLSRQGLMLKKRRLGLD